MPRNRAEIDRSQKMDEILEAAIGQLRANGYSALSVDGVAQSLGIARNAIYWYFPSRDDLFVDAAARILAETWARPPRTSDIEKRILWALERLSELQPLVAGLQDRARTVPAAAALVEQLQIALCRRLREILAGHIRDADLDLAADTIVMLGQGMLASATSREERARLLRFVLRRVAMVTAAES